MIALQSPTEDLLVMATNHELLAASDDTIEDAVAYASPMVLRGLLYQLTGDEEVHMGPLAAVLLVPPGETGEAAAYGCRDFRCQLPTTDPAKLKELLEEAVSKPGKS